MIRTYKYNIKSNKVKNEYIEKTLYPEWKRIAQILLKQHLNFYYKNSTICKDNSLYKTVNTFLTERYKDCINRQVVGMFESKISNFKKRYIKIVMKSDLNDDLKKDLCLVSKRNLFFKNTDDIGKNYTVNYSTIKLGRWIFKNFIGKYPTCKNINMVLQSKIVEIQKPKNKHFCYYLKLSSGNSDIRGKFYYIPLEYNKYADKTNGKLSTSCALEFENKKIKSVSLFKEVEPNKDLITNDLRLSIDIGITKLFSVNDGKIYGDWFIRRLKFHDKQLLKIQNNLKKQFGKHVKLSNYPVYTRYVKKLKDFIKNEINRLFNKIIKRYKPSTIIVENLDFKNSNIGRTNNRLLSIFGLGQIKAKLKDINESYGIEVNFIDPAYSSQTCCKCGYIDPKNRTSQAVFNCRCCDNKINADVNASRTLNNFFERFKEKMFLNTNDRNNKRTQIVNDFISNNLRWRNDKRIVQMINSNPYFKDLY